MSASMSALISDLDGTLVDTRSANVAAYRSAFLQVGVAFDEDAFHCAYGHAFNDMMTAVAPALTGEQRRAIKRAKTDVYSQHLGLAVVNDGLVRLLQTARSTGQGAALVSTARRESVDSVLRHFDLERLFSLIITAEDVARPKPHPDGYLLAARLLGLNPAECVVFEDSTIGLAAARAAGCAVIKVAA